MQVIKKSGLKESYDFNKIAKVLQNANALFGNEGLDELDIEEVIQDIEMSIHDNIDTQSIYQALLHALLSRAIDDPKYDRLTRNVLLQKIYKQAFGGVYTPSSAYKDLFIDYIDNAVELGILDENIVNSFDLEYLAGHLDYTKDSLFKFNGLYNLSDRYLIKDIHTSNILEAPQWFWMRVSIGVAYVEPNIDQRNYWAVEFYKMMSNMEFIPSTPTLFNSATKYAQLSSCFIVDLEDDLNLIFDTVKQVGVLNKFSGGVGLPATKLRAKDSIIKSIQGKSSGMIPFLKIIDETITTVSQGGKRRGSALASLEPWHLDVFDFVRAKRKWGDESQRFKNLKTAIFTNDEFMKRVVEDADWYLFDPVDCPKLINSYGKKFSREYSKCIRKALSNQIRYKKVKAIELYKEIIENIMSNSEPWITFKDPINIRHPNKHTGTILTTNLCTEQLLVSTYEAVESCNLGSLVLPKFLENNTFNWDKFRTAVRKAIRFLDNVIDANYYALKEVEKGTKLSRKIGLGFMGYQNMIEKLKLPTESIEAIRLLDMIGEVMSYEAIDASCELAKERGIYPNYENSDWSKGILPIDTLKTLFKERNMPENYIDDFAYSNVDVKQIDEKYNKPKLDFDMLREKVKQGIRNACQTTLAPTATISIIAGTSQSFEPYYALVYSRTNIAGRFLEVNENFVNELKALGLWEKLREDVLLSSGSIQNLDISQELKDIYKTAFEISTTTYLKQASVLQKWIDSSVSRNIYFGTRDEDELMNTYIQAWKLGLKSTYYAFLPAKIKTEGKYVHEDIKEQKDQKVMLLSEVMDKQGYCESCGS